MFPIGGRRSDEEIAAYTEEQVAYARRLAARDELFNVAVDLRES